ncbi:MAG: hypothetical protein MJ202_08805 [Lentisphaeria bacterium]|nr:hypothetical protein [Lentisphaeria bacterium]
MRISQEIRILDLLAHRDAEFLRIQECEEKIRQILGGADFPFPAPPVELPSASRKGRPWQPEGIALPQPSKKSDRRKTTPAKQENTVPALAPLDPGKENAYRLVFHDRGETKVSYLQNLHQLKEMLSLACETFHIDCIETVDFRQLDDYTVVRRLL